MGRADVEADVAAVNAAGGNVAHTFQGQDDGCTFVVNIGDASGTITVLLDVDAYPKHTFALFTADSGELCKLAEMLQQRCGGGRLIDIKQVVDSIASRKLARLRELLAATPDSRSRLQQEPRQDDLREESRA